MATRVNPGADNVVYLYGVTEKEIPLTKIAGVDGGNPVEAIPCAGLVCWVSRVSRAEFADNLPANMENLDWLAEASVQHQRVVSAIARETDILPARFGTVFLTAASLETDVRSKKSILEKDFARIRGSDEFGIKVFSVPPKIEAPAIPAGSGKDYLKAKAALLQRRPAKQQTPDPALQDFQGELGRIAVATAESGKISGGQRGLQWQTSVLLRRADRKKFDALLRRYCKQWAGERRIECTGPWPAYSFVSRAEVATEK
ncbi:MAG TPA: GvpL/GvpF family gas vesicle protein [Terriglobales bacterium]